MFLLLMELASQVLLRNGLKKKKIGLFSGSTVIPEH